MLVGDHGTPLVVDRRLVRLESVIVAAGPREQSIRIAIPDLIRNLVPTTTGAAKALGPVLRELAGKLHGYAVRVPVPTGSLVDLMLEIERPTTAEEVNALVAARADRGELEGILAYSGEPLVSSDLVRSPYSSIFDAGLTAVVDGTQVKVVAWYDNEWDYSNRLVDLAQRVVLPVTV